MFGERKKGMRNRLVSVLLLAFIFWVLWVLYKRLTKPFISIRSLSLKDINSVALDLIVETRSRSDFRTISVEIHYDSSLLELTSLGPYNNIEVSDIESNDGILKVKFRNAEGRMVDKAEIARLTFKSRDGQREVETNIEVSSRFA